MKKFLIISFLTYALVSCKTPNNQSSETNLDSLGAINSKIIDTSKLVNKQFSLTYTIGDSLYLFEKHKLNTTVTIIDNDKGHIFEAKTTGYIAYSDDILGDIVLTRIFPQPRLQNNSNYFAVFSNKPNDYNDISSENITDAELIKSIDTLIRANVSIDSLLRKNGDFYNESDSSTKSILPEIQKFSDQGNDIFIATYKIYNNSTIGPRLAILESRKVIPLTAPCSYKYLYVYKFKGKNYIQTGSSCCNCGYVGDQIFEIETDDIELVFEDYSFSN